MKMTRLLYVVTLLRCSVWKFIEYVFCISAAIDLDSISRNPDFNVLQDNILNVAFCSIESEIVSIT